MNIPHLPGAAARTASSIVSRSPNYSDPRATTKGRDARGRPAHWRLCATGAIRILISQIPKQREKEVCLEVMTPGLDLPPTYLA